MPVRIQTPDLAFVDALQQQLTTFQSTGKGEDLLLSIVPAEPAVDGLLTDIRTNAGRFSGAFVPYWAIPDLVRENALERANPPPSELPAPMSRLRSFGGEWVATDLDHNCDLLFFRRDLLAQSDASVPDHWAEFIVMLDATDLAIALPRTHAAQVVDHVVAMAASYVGDAPMWFDPATFDPVIASEPHQRALQDWQALSVHAVDAQSTGDLWQAFAEGSAAFLIASSDAYAYFHSIGLDLGNVGVAALPGYRDTSGTVRRAGNTIGANWGGVTLSGRANIDAVRGFLDSLAMPVAQQTLWTDASTGISPVAEDPAAGAAVARDAGWPEEPTAAWLDAIAQTWSEPLQLLPLRIAETRRYLQALERQIVSLLNGESPSAADALTDAAEEWRSINQAIDVTVQRDLYDRSIAPPPSL